VQYAFGFGIGDDRDVMDELKERFAFWWEMQNLVHQATPPLR